MDFKRRLTLGLITVVSIFLYAKAGPNWISSWGIDPATYIFLAFLPLLVILRASPVLNGFLAVASLVFTAYFSLSKYDKTAESFAIIVFFLFATSVFQSIYEIYSNPT